MAVIAPGGPAALAATIPGPAITVADGNSVIAVQTSGNGLRFYWNEHGTNTWHGEQVAANGTTFSPPSIAQDGNAVVIAAQGPTPAWISTGRPTAAQSGTRRRSPARGRPSPAITANNGSVNVVALGPNAFGTLFYWAQNCTTTWHLETLPGLDVGAPAITTSPGGVHVVAATFSSGSATSPPPTEPVPGCGPRWPGCSPPHPSRPSP
ncbi:MAG: hypothetical protein ACR2FU_10545 [Streptosporangiaceae bacterium]